MSERPGNCNRNLPRGAVDRTAERPGPPAHLREPHVLSDRRLELGVGGWVCVSVCVCPITLKLSDPEPLIRLEFRV